MEQEITRQMDSIDFPPNFREHPRFPVAVPLEVKKWGALKLWAAQNQDNLSPEAQGDIRQLLRLHLQAVMRVRSQIAAYSAAQITSSLGTLTRGNGEMTSQLKPLSVQELQKNQQQMQAQQQYLQQQMMAHQIMKHDRRERDLLAEQRNALQMEAQHNENRLKEQQEREQREAQQNEEQEPLQLAPEPNVTAERLRIHQEFDQLLQEQAAPIPDLRNLGEENAPWFAVFSPSDME
jgi:hypothetical protein